MKLQLTELATNDRFEFSILPVVIGRDSTADVQLDDPMLSPHQCMIGKRADGGTMVRNLSDDFPLYVNGGRVTKAELSPGDILTIGRNRFVLSYEATIHRR